MGKLVRAICITAGLLMLASSPAVAAEGWYIGVDYVHTVIDGDFDGTNTYVSGTDTILIPDIDPGNGLGLRIGYALPTNFSFELGLTSTKHDAAWIGFPLDVEHNELSIDMKYSFGGDESKMRPYLRGGVSAHHLEMNRGANGVTTAELSGAGLNLGGGVDYHFTQKLSFDTALTLKLVEYDDAKAGSTDGELDPAIDGNGFEVKAGLAYHF